MKKKGFTLIELLGVIIVLSVIALITVPLVLDVVDEARIQANTATAHSYLEAAKLYKTESIFDSTKENDIEYVNNIYSKISVKGTKPNTGELYINKNGESALAVVLDGKCYYKAFYQELMIKEEGECTLGWVGVDEEIPTLTAKEEEITIEVGTKVDVKSYFNKPIYGPSGGTLSCDIEDTSLLEAGEYVITCTALGTNGKSVTATKTITIDYEQLVNYTMLYDNGNENVTLTGGWSVDGHTSDRTVYSGTKYETYMNCTSTDSSAQILGTQNLLDFTEYANIHAQFNTTRPATACISVDVVTTKNSIDTTSLLARLGSALTSKHIVTSPIIWENPAYVRVFAVNGGLSVYNVWLTKEDEYEKLGEQVGNTFNSINELLSDATLISNVLSNESAVRYMTKQCTGDFMTAAIQSETFMTALESSPYKDLVYANTHWAKFLNMVQ